MSWGPKSAKRRARTARQLKSVAQSIGFAGEKQLVDLVAAAIVAGIPQGVDERVVVANAKRVLGERGLTESMAGVIVGKALTEAQRAVSRA